MPAFAPLLAAYPPHWPPLSLPQWDEGFGDSINQQWTRFLEWLTQPHVLPILLAWMVTFTVFCMVLALGFRRDGVGASTPAAAFQSYMYGALTPAGGIFATLTSMAMLGTFMPVVVLIAAVIATAVAAIVWKTGLGAK
ncbi:hypothetical protein QBC33DRAFT_562411 [Phialemonium atrogriseum]|uniref:Uncharacterized protein n=1 Tax=Phialemonium atrogriseum TaxID=1093897 RepID=A0AAJ0FCQ2_9PEZI|nr:uncharacterized protein QBC33DRAFT_562411 [Phialemonium atrogriseum]KAK1763826.1 hypothetical protein QBC33DRAFT_562411 [Phialemonium atrogriseum]